MESCLVLQPSERMSKAIVPSHIFTVVKEPFVHYHSKPVSQMVFQLMDAQNNYGKYILSVTHHQCGGTWKNLYNHFLAQWTTIFTGTLGTAAGGLCWLRWFVKSHFHWVHLCPKPVHEGWCLEGHDVVKTNRHVYTVFLGYVCWNHRVENTAKEEENCLN